MPPSTAERAWTTSGVPPREQFALWTSLAAEAWVPVDVTRSGAGSFPSHLTARTVGGLDLSRISTEPQAVSRTAEQVARDPGAKLFLNLPLTHGSFARQDGRTAQLAPGDFAIVDSARPFDLSFSSPLQQISVALPAELLLSRLARPMAATAVRVRGDDGVGAVASSALRALAETRGSLDRHLARMLADQVLDLVALALGSTHADSSRELLLQATLDEIERSLGDPALTPTLVADRVGISVRYLHRLLSERGPSFGRWVLARRLERSRAELADPSSARPVAAIAIANGFADPGYFARAYRTRYGEPPRATRAQAR